MSPRRRGQRECARKILEEIKAEIFPNLMEIIKPQILQLKYIEGYIEKTIVKLLKTNNKVEILKAAKEKKAYYIERNNARISLNANESTASGSQCNDIFKVLKEQNLLHLEFYIQLKYSLKTRK